MIYACCLTGRTMNHNLGMPVSDAMGPPPVEGPVLGFEGLGRPHGSLSYVFPCAVVHTLTLVCHTLTLACYCCHTHLSHVDTRSS